MQNFVAVCHTVWVYVLKVKKIWGALGSPLLMRGRIWPSRNTPVHTCYSAKFGRSKSSHMGI